MYRLKTAPAALRDMVKLERRVLPAERERLRTAIRELAVKPRPQGVRKIVGHKDRYRIRIGDFRIVYEVSDAESSVRIVKIVRRSESTYDF